MGNACNSSPILRLAHGIAASRLKFSLAKDSALARNNATDTCSRIKACSVGQPCPVGPAVASKAMLGDELVEFSAAHLSNVGAGKTFTRQVLDFLLA